MGIPKWLELTGLVRIRTEEVCEKSCLHNRTHAGANSLSSAIVDAVKSRTNAQNTQTANKHQSQLCARWHLKPPKEANRYDQENYIGQDRHS